MRSARVRAEVVVRRTVFRVAGRASAFIASKLETAPEETPICVMVQADGANMPVATLERLEGQTTSTGRPKMKKTCFYREARLGLALPDGADDPTYIAQVGNIERFADSLAAAARYRGADGAFAYAVTDGGNGLRERLENVIDIGQYILDKGHAVNAHQNEPGSAHQNEATATAGGPGWKSADVPARFAGSGSPLTLG